MIADPGRYFGGLMSITRKARLLPAMIRARLTYHAGVYWSREGLLSRIARPFEYLFGVTMARQQINRVVPQLLQQMRGDIIDIGGYDNRLKRRYRAGNIINVDIEPGPFVDMVIDAGDMKAVPSDSLGGVLCISVLEHSPTPEKILREIHRVLKPSGLAYISTPWMFESHMEPNDFHRFSPYWWEQRLNGFEVIDVHYSNSLAGCMAHFMQHSLALRATIGVWLFLLDLLCKPGPRYASQIGYILKKS